MSTPSPSPSPSAGAPASEGPPNASQSTGDARSDNAAQPENAARPENAAQPGNATQPIAVTHRRASLMTQLAVRISRERWRDRAELWADDASTTLAPVFDAVLAESRESAGGIAVDLGCGSGQVTLALARLCTQVLAVDIDAGAIELLAKRAQADGLTNIEGMVRPLETFELGAASVDLIVSNYALHHLRDADKQALLERCLTWLRPGGRLVIGDMMFGRGAAKEDREIIRGKVTALIGRGPAGWWRVLKNAGRFLLRFQEKPLRPDIWQSMLIAAGFEAVRIRHVVAEAHVVSGTKPL